MKRGLTQECQLSLWLISLLERHVSVDAIGLERLRPAVLLGLSLEWHIMYTCVSTVMAWHRLSYLCIMFVFGLAGTIGGGN